MQDLVLAFHAEITNLRMYYSDLLRPVHRSRGDSNQNEAERTKSAIGVDSPTIEWEIFKKFEGMSASDINKLSLNEYEEYEDGRMKKNAWGIAK